MSADMLLLVLRDGLWSGIAALGFAILFNVPVRTLPGCLLVGAVGHALRTLLMQFGMGIEAATLVGATAVGFLSLRFAQRWHTPPTVFAVSGAIPMVPGVFAYETMLGLLRIATQAAPSTAVLTEAMVNAVKTALILGAIAGGITAPGLLFRRRKPVHEAEDD
jgi:uncharacterized membrane protein YjjB (DUF3815 family)